MMTWILNFLQNSHITLFWASAVVGTTLFGLRMLMTLFGGALEIDDADADSFELYEDDQHHSVPSFKLFTLHSIAGFLMMFGWVGLACSAQYGYSLASSCGIAFLAGFGVMLITALIFRGALLFEASGAVFSSQKSVGLVGTVYQQIPADGQGKIQIMVNGVTRELLAQSVDKKAIESFTLVRVVNFIDHEIVEVAELRRDLP